MRPVVQKKAHIYNASRQMMSHANPKAAVGCP